MFRASRRWRQTTSNTDNPEQLLRREGLAEDLQSLGYPITAKTLATMACRGGGPPFELFGKIPLYRRGPGRAWAQSRLASPARSTAKSQQLKKAQEPESANDQRPADRRQCTADRPAEDLVRRTSAAPMRTSGEHGSETSDGTQSDAEVEDLFEIRGRS